MDPISQKLIMMSGETDLDCWVCLFESPMNTYDSSFDIDSNGNIYVATVVLAQEFCRVVKLTPDGQIAWVRDCDANIPTLNGGGIEGVGLIINSYGQLVVSLTGLSRPDSEDPNYPGYYFEGRQFRLDLDTGSTIESSCISMRTDRATDSSSTSSITSNNRCVAGSNGEVYTGMYQQAYGIGTRGLGYYKTTNGVYNHFSSIDLQRIRPNGIALDSSESNVYTCGWDLSSGAHLIGYNTSSGNITSQIRLDKEIIGGFLKTASFNDIKLASNGDFWICGEDVNGKLAIFVMRPTFRQTNRSYDLSGGSGFGSLDLDEGDNAYLVGSSGANVFHVDSNLVCQYRALLDAPGISTLSLSSIKKRGPYVYVNGSLGNKIIVSKLPADGTSLTSVEGYTYTNLGPVSQISPAHIPIVETNTFTQAGNLCTPSTTSISSSSVSQTSTLYTLEET